MNCRETQDGLMLMVGQSTLPDSIQQHLNECSGCRQFWTELNRQVEALGSDEDFYIDDATVARLTAEVDRRIDQLELSKVTSISSAWKTYVPAAAAVVLLVGISFTVYLAGWFGGSGQQADLIQPDQPWDALADQEIKNIAQDEWPDVLGALFIDGDQAVQAMLQDDLTEAEYEYLDENLDGGDIL